MICIEIDIVVDWNWIVGVGIHKVVIPKHALSSLPNGSGIVIIPMSMSMSVTVTGDYQSARVLYRSYGKSGLTILKVQTEIRVHVLITGHRR